MTNHSSEQNLEGLKEKVRKTHEEFLSLLKNFKGDLQELKDLKASYLGKKSVLTSVMKEIGKLSVDEKKEFGPFATQYRQEMDQTWSKIFQALEDEQVKLELLKNKIDISLPSKKKRSGHLHPVSKMMIEIEEIFSHMGFSVRTGPEIEKDFYCFEALNIGKDHPARGMHDTFYINHKEETLLRTHTSPVQIRTMLKEKPPLRILAPGRVYRSDFDRTHTPMFHQVEGLVVDKDVTLGQLKWTLTHFIQELFGSKINVRFRSSFFPFTEPSFEVDMQCMKCLGKGCSLCKGTGWIEVLGCGMVHPEVFKNVNLDPKEFSGFAFGLGVDRMAMLKYSIDDLRPMFENRTAFLNQF